MKVTDPNGHELLPVLLQVLESNERGPRVLVLRHDDETIPLGEMPEEQRKFFTVYAPKDSTLPLTEWTSILRELESLKGETEADRRKLDDLKTRHETRMREHRAVVADNEQKTEALRELQRERDPERVAAQIRAAVTEATIKVEGELAVARGEVARLTSELNEAKASKKKLRESLERLKKGGRP